MEPLAIVPSLNKAHLSISSLLIMSFFFKALMAYSFPVALYWASSTWKTTEKLYFKQSCIPLLDYFNSNWCQLFPSTPDSHPQIQTPGTWKMEHFCFAPCAAAVQKDASVSYVLLPNSTITAGPCFRSTSEFTEGAMHSFGDGAAPLVILMKWMVMVCFDLALSGQLSPGFEVTDLQEFWLLTKGTSCLCSWAGFAPYLHCNKSLLYCNVSIQTPRQSPIVTTTALLPRVLLYYLPKVATAQHSNAVKILELNCPFPAEKQRRDSTPEMYEQVTEKCVFVPTEEALCSKKESKQLCRPLLT